MAVKSVKPLCVTACLKWCRPAYDSEVAHGYGRRGGQLLIAQDGDKAVKKCN